MGLACGVSMPGSRNKWVYIFAVALSAWLVFWMEPLYSKMLLPLFGGAPQVWIVALMFFQSVLLGGYLYAHALVRLPNVGHQGIVHGVFCLLAALFLPPVVGDVDVAAVTESPIRWILWMLMGGIGVPLMVLSATAPLVQHWFSLSGHKDASDPYFLYAASNIGSFGALLSFPLVMEPQLTTQAQTGLWSVLFAIAMLSVLAGCYLVARQGDREAPETEASSRLPMRVDWLNRLHWIVLAAVPSSLLAGVTSLLTTDVAALPLLWVVPLMIYLGTYILAFANLRLMPDWLMRGLLGVSLAGLALAMIGAAGGSADYISDAGFMGLALIVQFLLSLACHRALYERRPAAQHLTGFYIAISAGGLLGGAFNAVVAPQLFTSVAEFPIALVLAVALSRQMGEAGFPQSRYGRGAVIALFASALVSLAWLLLNDATLRPTGWLFLCVLLVLFMRVPWAMAAAAAMLFISIGVFAERPGLIFAERNFYGTVRIYDREDLRVLYHGTTIHGQQLRDPNRATERLSYYGVNSPISSVFDVFDPELSAARIGFFGLGAGSLSCLKKPGQFWRYYEIDPLIAKLATDENYFGFMPMCDADASLANGRVVLGDARQQLAVHSDIYDLMVLDAFTSDAIPLHLLTKEAFELYLSRLTLDGLIAVHISNRHLDLRPAIGKMASHFGLFVAQGDDDVELKEGEMGSRWLVLSRSEEKVQRLLDAPSSPVAWQSYAAPQDTRLWTDDYSNILLYVDWPDAPDIGHLYRRARQHVANVYMAVRRRLD